MAKNKPDAVITAGPAVHYDVNADRVRQLAERLFVATWSPNNGYQPARIAAQCMRAARDFYDITDVEQDSSADSQ